MLAMLLEAAAAATSSTVAPDLRTAIATEHLAWATAALAFVGFLTLMAASFAAAIAVATYNLEVCPGLVLSPTSTFEAYRNAVLYDIGQPYFQVYNPPNPPSIFRASSWGDVNVERLGIYDVRNVGRCAVIGLCVTIKIETYYNDEGTSPYHIMSSARVVVSTVDAEIGAIGPNDSTALAFRSWTGCCRLTVVGVTAARPSVKPASGRVPRLALPFAAAMIDVGNSRPET